MTTKCGICWTLWGWATSLPQYRTVNYKDLAARCGPQRANYRLCAPQERSSKRKSCVEIVESPESIFTCGTTCGTMIMSERERGKNMWTVFNKNTGKVVADGFETEVDAMMWIDAQENRDELDCAPF